MFKRHSSVFSALGAFSFLALSQVVTLSPAKAVQCSGSVTPTFLESNLCTAAALTYGITIYQIGLCQSDPLATSTPDTSSCFLLFNNSSGQYVDIGLASPNPTIDLNLLSAEQRPASIPYQYLYLRASNVVRFKGQATLSTGTFYSTSTAFVNPDPAQFSNGTLASSNPAQYSEYSSTTSIAETTPPSCYAANGVGGSIALVTAGLLPTTYNAGTKTCPGATYLVASATTAAMLGSTLKFTGQEKTINVRFSATDSIGVIATPVGGGGHQISFDFLGFNLSMRLGY